MIYLSVSIHLIQKQLRLPYGLQKRVELGRALAMQPKLLLLDEPVAGMSHKEREETGNLLRRIGAERTVVVVEHDMDFMRAFATSVTVLARGQVIAEGSVADVQANPKVQEVYLGSATAVADGTTEESDDQAQPSDKAEPSDQTEAS